MTHSDLVYELAHAQDHREWMVFAEPTLGIQSETAKPDLLLIRKSWARYEVRAIEVKVTQADLNQDVKKLKFEKYFRWCDRISFCVAQGIKTDVLEPHPVGIIKWSEAGPRTKKAAPRIQGDKMTRSFEMFHALNMGESRVQFNQRLQSVREQRHWLEMKQLSSDYQSLYNIKSGELRELIREADNKQKISSEAAVENFKRKFTEEIIEILGLESYWGNPTPNDLIQRIVREESQKSAGMIQERIGKLFTLSNAEPVK